RPWYERCAAYEFSVLPCLTDLVPAWSPADWKLIEADLCKMLSFITVRPPLPLPDGAFVSLTVPDVARLVPDLASVSVGADAMELRVEYVRRQLGVLRRHSDLPIIFTVRTKAQGGRFPDDRQREHAALLEKGLEWGCEYVDAEITLPDGALRRLSERRGNARIIASWHDLAGVARRSGEVVKRAAKFGDIVKMVGTVRTLVDNFPVRESAREEGGAVESFMEGKPAIVINMGAEGQLSRCLNRFLTPATHPALPTKAAPGQLSVAEINTARHLIGLLPARKYFLFGCPIAQSPSPALHNAGFRALALPHVYALYETGDAANLEPVMRSAEFGGASVTIPHKVDVAGMMDSVSPAARAIGAVNTVVAVDGPGGRTLLFGDNTDWLGIHDCVARKVGGDLAALRGEDGLVIGAGGTARAAVYALKELGLRTVRIWNRTYAKAADVARELGAEAAESLALLAAPAVVVATVPAEAQEPIREALRGLFERAAAGAGGARQDGETTLAARVAVEMAYRPTYTPFALAASNKGYSLETGLGVLVAQGLRQFEIWTGKRPPAETMIFVSTTTLPFRVLLAFAPV
ncbi:MAG: type I 3-dehydroquinase-domain-containing protein, partial [Olpidium bornovanus]